MFQVKIIRYYLSLLGSSFSLISYANCPSISQIEVLADNSYTARTEQGIWTQYKYEQSNISPTGTTELLSLYYVFGINRVYSNNLTSAYDKIVCIYHVKNTNSVASQPSENQQLVSLKSPENQRYVVTFDNESESMNGWNTFRNIFKNINTNNAYCGTNKWPIGNESAFYYCGFDVL